MKILGIHYGHNATVSFMEEGAISFCQSEERLNRIKNSTGFPLLTLEYIYNNIVPPEKIDMAVLFQRSIYGYLHLKSKGFKPYQYGQYLDPSLVKTGLKQRLAGTDLGWEYEKAKILRRERDKRLHEEAHNYFSRSLRLPKEKVLYLDHHLAHAYGTVPNIKGWERVLVFTLDGSGDWVSATVNLYEEEKMTVLSRTDHRNSLGYYYSATTALLGMKSGEHEFKVMGLAPYARSAYYSKILERLRALLKVDENGGWVSAVNPIRLTEALEGICRYQRFDNVAGAIQELTEELIVKWIDYWVDKTGCRDIAVAGGVFMNVKACQKVAELKCVDRLFVMPSGADESTAIGCAVWGCETYDKDAQVMPVKDLYLGMEFDDAAIEEAIEETGAAGRYEISKKGKINQVVGNLLAEDKIVARCTGRMEFGARALGNRSILANPSRMENLHVINDAIKSRDFWMPFCPSILEEDMPRYIKNHDRIFAPYMCITFNSTEEARRDIIAALHPRDYTVRPQSVIKEWNPDYYEIIKSFKDATGIGAILNTSFNLHGEPNVCSPLDAIRTVDNSGLDYLAMNDYLLVKKKSGNP